MSLLCATQHFLKRSPGSHLLNYHCDLASPELETETKAAPCIAAEAVVRPPKHIRRAGEVPGLWAKTADAIPKRLGIVDLLRVIEDLLDDCPRKLKLTQGHVSDLPGLLA